MLSLPPALHSRQAIKERDSRAEIDTESQLSCHLLDHPAHQSGTAATALRNYRDTDRTLLRRSTSTCPHGLGPCLPCMDPSDSQISACNGHPYDYDTQCRAMQCSAITSTGVVLASCLVSSQGWAARGGAYCALYQPQLAATCQSSPLRSRRPLRSRLPGMVLQDHVAFRFRCALKYACPARCLCPALPAYRRARACWLAGHVSSTLLTPPARSSCLPSRPSSNRQVDMLIPVLSLGPWPQSLFES